jgi:cAMP-binding proteins - catabolite gene activator and regulatory subunit of cAMP-dependent protein kinases
MPTVSRPPNRLLQLLPAAEFQSLHPHLETVELAKGTVLTEAGAPVPHVYLPHSGIVSVMVSLSEGQTVEVAMLGRDSLIGTSAALDDGPALADAIVVVPGLASVLKTEDLRTATDRNAGLRKLLVRHEQALLVQAQQSAACNASHSVESRLSRLLLRARDLSDSEGLPLTQEFLAQMIGVRRNAFRSWRTRFNRPASSATAGGTSKSGMSTDCGRLPVSVTRRYGPNATGC